MTVEFYDRELHRDFHFTDPYQYDKACLSESAAHTENILADKTQMTMERSSPTTLRMGALPISSTGHMKRGRRVQIGGRNFQRERWFEVSLCNKALAHHTDNVSSPRTKRVLHCRHNIKRLCASIHTFWDAVSSLSPKKSGRDLRRLARLYHDDWQRTSGIGWPHGDVEIYRGECQARRDLPK